MEGGDTGGYSHGVLKSMTNDECRSSFCFVFVCGQLLSSVGTSFLYAGGCFHTWVVVTWWWWWQSAVAGLSISLPLSVTWHLASLSAKKVGGEVCLHTCWWSLQLVTWLLDVIGEGVVLGARRRWCHSWVVCCCPAVVVAWSSSVVVVVVVSHHCHRSWLLMWFSCVVRMVYRRVQVVVSGGQWCGDDGWVL